MNPPPESTTKERRAEAVYRQVRADIYAADLAPGAPITFPELCSSYGISVGVAREVLTKLVGDSLVVQVPHHGYHVVELSLDELTDLTTARIHLESLVLRESVLHGGPQWEAQVLSAHHLLSKTPLPTELSSDEMQQWSTVHESFHASLLAACPSRRLTRAARAMREESELYRRWSGAYGKEPLGDPEGHAAMAQAALDHDADRAAELLRDHIAHTAQALVSGFSAAMVDDQALKPRANRRTRTSARSR